MFSIIVMAKAIVSLTIDYDIKEKAMKLIQARGQKLSPLVNEFLINYINEEEKNEKEQNDKS